MPDYKHETETLLATLKKHGLEPVEAHYSGDSTEELEPTYEDMSNVEDACLYVEFKDTGKRTWLRLIYGNGRGELISDYGIPKDEQFEAALEAACDEFYDMHDR